MKADNTIESCGLLITSDSDKSCINENKSFNADLSDRLSYENEHETADSKNSSLNALDDIPDLAAYMNVRTPPTPPTASELVSDVDNNFNSLVSESASRFLNSEDDNFQNVSSEDLLMNTHYINDCQMMTHQTNDQSYNQFSCMSRPGMVENIATPRKRQVIEMTPSLVPEVTCKQEAKPKTKRRRRRTAGQAASSNDSWANNPVTPTSHHDVNYLHQTCNSTDNSDLTSDLIVQNSACGIGSPLTKRRASSSKGRTPSSSPITIVPPQSMGSNFLQNQSQVFVFSSKLANQAAESVRNGRYANIIDFHRALPATSRLLSCLQSNTQSNRSNDWYNINSNSMGSTVKDSDMLTPEQLKKRQENLAKLQGIGELLNVYPSCSTSQMDSRRNPQMNQSIRTPCTISPPRMYRLGNSPDMACRRNVMIGPNGQLVSLNGPMNHVTRCGTPMYVDPYGDCPSMMAPSSGNCQSNSAQLDWQRLQTEFFEKRANEQQMGVGMVRMPNGPVAIHPSGPQLSCGRRMMLMKAGQPERYTSAVDFLRRTGCPSNAFNTGCEMQMCPSPKQMNYEIDGQELIITKQLNNRNNSRLSQQDKLSSMMSVANSVSVSNTSNSTSELAPPLSSMLEMTNSIPQPSISPPTSSSLQTSSSTNVVDSTNRTSENCTPPLSHYQQKNPQLISMAQHYSSDLSQQSIPLSIKNQKQNSCSNAASVPSEYRRNVQQHPLVQPSYDFNASRNNPMYKCQQPLQQPINARHYSYPGNNPSYYFDEFGQQVDGMMGNNTNVGSNNVCSPAVHNGHGPPSVNNTYVNATMSIQQLNIQSVQPGPQSQGVNQHAGQPPSAMYSQQQHSPALSNLPHHVAPQYMNSPHQPSYVMNNGGQFEDMGQTMIATQRPMPNVMMQQPQMIIMRGGQLQQQSHHMAPRLIPSRSIRYDPSGHACYNMPPGGGQGVMMMSGRPEYASRMAMSGNAHQPLHDMGCSYNGPMLNQQSRIGPVGNMIRKPSMMMMSSDCRDRMMQQQMIGPASYNHMMMSAVNTNNGMDHHMVGMMNSGGSTSGISYMPSSTSSMMDSYDSQRKSFEMMDPVSAKLAEAGMLIIRGDPLEPIYSKQQTNDGDGSLSSMFDNQQFIQPQRPPPDVAQNPNVDATSSSSLYTNPPSCAPCKEEVLQQ